MENSKKNTIAWVLRIVIAALFILSAITKMVTGEWAFAESLWMFEKQLVDLSICNWCTSHYLARLLIGFELALGIAILFPYLLKKLVIPVTIALLVAFCIHLSIQMIEFGPMNGNCGCFGTAIPMTPLEAFIKNIITIGLLVWLFKLLPSKDENWGRIIYPILMFLMAALFMFMVFPFCPCDKDKQIETGNIDNQIESLGLENINGTDDTTGIENIETNVIDTDVAKTIGVMPTDPKETTTTKIIDETKNIKTKTDVVTKKIDKTKTVTPKVETGPSPKKSVFAEFVTFNGKKVKVDEGKKVLCMFAPGCDHCQHTAKEIGALAKANKIPPVYIYFMDEETDKIPAFFKEAGVKFPYQVLGIGNFWDLLSIGSTPGVFLQHNGNTVQSFEGINENEFDIKKFKEFAIEK